MWVNAGVVCLSSKHSLMSTVDIDIAGLYMHHYSSYGFWWEGEAEAINWDLVSHGPLKGEITSTAVCIQRAV